MFVNNFKNPSTFNKQSFTLDRLKYYMCLLHKFALPCLSNEALLLVFDIRSINGPALKPHFGHVRKLIAIISNLPIIDSRPDCSCYGVSS